MGEQSEVQKKFEELMQDRALRDILEHLPENLKGRASLFYINLVEQIAEKPELLVQLLEENEDILKEDEVKTYVSAIWKDLSFTVPSSASPTGLPPTPTPRSPTSSEKAMDLPDCSRKSVPFEEEMSAPTPRTPGRSDGKPAVPFIPQLDKLYPLQSILDKLEEELTADLEREGANLTDEDKDDEILRPIRVRKVRKGAKLVVEADEDENDELVRPIKVKKVRKGTKIVVQADEGESDELVRPIRVKKIRKGKKRVVKPPTLPLKVAKRGKAKAFQAFQVRPNSAKLMAARVAQNDVVEMGANQKPVPIKRRDATKTKRAESKEEEAEFLCDLCAKAFKYKNNLQRHIKEAHGTQSIFRCSICAAEFTRSRNLVAHLKAMHAKKRTEFVCGVCGKIYFVRQSYNKHVKTCK